ncbi:peptide chain release factor-like protein [endosymbiont of Pachyrhynchus infernalis]|uniref:peptide chain release factor-like protein n=1 Tax=endosymbiont of Pachyrhynchus infernalis TaxID=1971488 RepID=UPI000DC73571|nr:peptide chain release factor 1 [endosymbiont of Pachyrhynchus infernalis]
MKKEKNINDNILGCLIEIKSGTGGYESSLFIKDLLKMYIKYSNKKMWDTEIINRNIENKECKNVILKINNNESYNLLKFESGGHRVQRIPKTESQGRIHTSTCIVAVIPITNEEKNKNINLNDLKIDTFKSSGSGGQHVNTTDSAVRITHIPTKLVVECQDERSQHKNKEKALSILKCKLYILKENQKKIENNLLKKKLLGSGNRSDRIRTYNFINNRVTDHRIFLNINKLKEILNGNLDLIISKLSSYKY